LQQYREASGKILHTTNDVTKSFSEADATSTWVNDLRRELAQQSERITALEQEINNMKGMVAACGDCLDTLGQMLRKGMKPARRLSRSKNEAERNKIIKKRKNVRFT
jgi:uncharacterized coiled-coil DUF342 family protein